MNSSDLAVVAAIAAEEAAARAVAAESNVMDVDQQNKSATTEVWEKADCDMVEETHLNDQAASKEPKDTIDEAINEGAKEEDYESSDLGSSSSSEEEEEEEEEEKHSVGGWDDDGEDEDQAMTILRTTNEITKIVVEKPDFDIKPNMSLSRVGHIHEVIDKVIVVQSDPNIPALDMGTLFTYSDRSIMGEVFETFGPVFKPFYSVLFNSAEEIDASKAVVGSEVLFVADYERTKVVPTEELRKMKFTDASNMFDEEISGSGEEFSDDEAELQHKRAKKKPKGKAKGSQNPSNYERSTVRGKPFNPATKRRFYDEPDDFDSALAAYEQSSNQNRAGPSMVPQRQMQSYADIFEGTADPFVNQPPASSVTQQYHSGAAATPSYMSPEELVRAHHGKQTQRAPQANPSRRAAGYNNLPPFTATTTTTTTTTTAASAIGGVSPARQVQAKQLPRLPKQPQIQQSQVQEHPMQPQLQKQQPQHQQHQHQQPQQQQQQQPQQQKEEEPQEGSARAVLLAMLRASQTPK